MGKLLVLLLLHVSLDSRISQLLDLILHRHNTHLPVPILFVDFVEARVDLSYDALYSLFELLRRALVLQHTHEEVPNIFALYVRLVSIILHLFFFLVFD